MGIFYQTSVLAQVALIAMSRIAVVSSEYHPKRLVDKNVSCAKQRCKRSEGNNDAPEHASALFLDCGFKHDDSLLVSVDEANRGLVRREFV